MTAHGVGVKQRNAGHAKGDTQPETAATLPLGRAELTKVFPGREPTGIISHGHLENRKILQQHRQLLGVFAPVFGVSSFARNSFSEFFCCQRKQNIAGGVFMQHWIFVFGQFQIQLAKTIPVICLE